MSESVVQVITSEDEQRRVEIFRRPNATYGFRELRWEAADNTWLLVGRYSECLADSPDRAVLEARSRVAWLESASRDRGLQYIVVFNDDVADVHGVAAELARAAGASVRFVYTSVLRGFAAYNVPAAGLPRL
jgi:hypothetical protein